METKLSIITINRNNANGLLKTMDSVFHQTFSGFEYIIVDGASTDNSCDVISDKNFIINGETIINSIRVKCISEPDSGVYEAMNKGIKSACGEYLLFLNSGDFLVETNVLNDVFSVIHTADILCGRCQVSNNGRIVWTSNPAKDITFGALYHEGLSHQSTFIRRCLFSELGMYRQDYKYNSDIDFWYRSIILHGASTEKLAIVVADYNLDGISSKENQTEQYQFEINEILSQANFSKFTPDYKSWADERKSMEVYYWAKENKLINGTTKLAYKLAVWLRNNRQK